MFNIAPEKRLLEDELSFWEGLFAGAILYWSSVKVRLLVGWLAMPSHLARMRTMMMSTCWNFLWILGFNTENVCEILSCENPWVVWVVGSIVWLCEYGVFTYISLAF